MIHEFKVIARYNTNVIKGTSWNSELKSLITVFKNEEKIINRAPTKEELPLVYDVALPSKEPNPAKPAEQRFFGTFKFFDEETEKSLKPAEQALNRQMRCWYQFLQIHDHVIVRGSDGQDSNTNDKHEMFELIDITGNTQKTVELNKKKTEAQKLLLDLFENSPEAFTDFCYAYGVPDVKNLDPDTLFNICMMKLINNPVFFMTIYNNKNRNILTLIEKGFTMNIGTEQEVKKVLDLRESGTVYLDGEPIAQNRNELEEILLMDVAKRRVIEGLVGYTITAGLASDKKETPKESVKEEEINFTKVAKSTGKNEEKLQKDFANLLRPILNFTKVTAVRDEKIEALKNDARFESIKIWAANYVTEQLVKKANKVSSPIIPKETNIN